MARAIACAALAVAGLAMALSPTAASAQPQQSSSGEFVDLAKAGGGGVRDAVEELASEGVFDGTGCAPVRLCPGDPVQRWVVAVWLVRVVDGRDPAAVSGTRFGDVDPLSWWAAHVERLAGLEITLGCGGGAVPLFCPEETVSRAQMASFLVRAFGLDTDVEPAGFVDVGDSVFAADIDALAAAGVTLGCGERLFCPSRAVTKAQMAAFLTRARTAAAAVSGEFVDLVEAGVFRDAVEELASEGVFDGTGCAPVRLCPGDPVQRWVVAVWLVRVVDGRDPAAVSGTRFGDVDPLSWWAAHVERLAGLEITLGCGGGAVPLFCPEETVSRAQMASFLVRAFGLETDVEPAGFVDVGDSVFAADIDALAAAGVTLGCGERLFCPSMAVTKAQMAAFLTRAAALESAGADTEEESAPVYGYSNDVPAHVFVDIRTGQAVSLRSLVNGSRPLLLWFWAPL